MNRERRTLFSFASARFKCSESGPLVVSSLLATLLSLRKGEIFSTAANNQPIVLKETPTRMYIYNEPLHDLTPFPDHLPTCTGSALTYIQYYSPLHFTPNVWTYHSACYASVASQQHAHDSKVSIRVPSSLTCFLLHHSHQSISRSFSIGGEPYPKGGGHFLNATKRRKGVRALMNVTYSETRIQRI